MKLEKVKEIFEEITDLIFPSDGEYVTLTGNQIYRLTHAIRRDYLGELYDNRYKSE